MAAVYILFLTACLQHPQRAARNVNLQYLRTSTQLQREANNISRQRLHTEQKHVAILENIHTELSLLRHAYYSVNGLVLESET